MGEFSLMERSLTFDVESCDVFDKISLVLEDIQKLIKSISKLLEKLEEVLQSLNRPVSLLQPSASSHHNYSHQKSSIPDNVKHTIEQPTVSGLHEIAGLKTIKITLHTLMILPRQQPQLFQNRSVSNSILLYGPPGTGKTRLVHGLAAESGAIFHTISVSDLLSSYVGETEKNIREIFHHLRTSSQFSLLFIDEIDGLCRKRFSTENEYSRRIKTELMCQMTKTEQNSNMVIIAATNCPWDLDSAILRRFQKRIYVPLPSSEDRLELFQLFTRTIPIITTPEESKKLIQVSEGFSGSDISSLVQDALNIPLTELQETPIWNKTADGFYEPLGNENSSVNIENICMNELKNLPACSVRARPVSVSDFLEAAKNFQVTVTPNDLKKYEMFKRK